MRDAVVRGFGLCAAIAFLSAWWQLPSLVGPGGVVPTGLSVEWMHSLCGAGTFASVALTLGVLPGPSLVGIYGCYLAIRAGSWHFFQYQWDGLLLESAVVLMLIAPWRMWLHRGSEPSLLGVWAIRLLVIKLMWMAGIAKLASGDATWASWTALHTHFQTQPLPHGLSWRAHHLPPILLTLGAGFALVVELVLPFAVFFRAGRVLFFVGTTLLMLLLSLTGTYGWFGLLTAVLAFSMLDDDLLEPLLQRPEQAILIQPSRVQTWAVGLAAAALALLNLVVLGAWALGPWAPPSLRPAAQQIAAVGVANPYGLFSRMTTERIEIGIELTADGKTWHEVEFLYKPGDPSQRPRWPGAHLPRLDWHLWFTALRPCSGVSPCLASCDDDAALAGVMEGLLDGSPQVRRLLLRMPVRDPLAVRAVRWDYRFAPPGDGLTWRRTIKGLQCPVRTR
ncbi:MAG: lipase maturation factor family protein [Myxococcota bacterium]